MGYIKISPIVLSLAKALESSVAIPAKLPTLPFEAKNSMISLKKKGA
jgi:hypothetical protein